MKEQEKKQVAFDVVRQQEIFLDVLVAVFAQLLGEAGIREQEANLVSGTVHRVR